MNDDPDQTANVDSKKTAPSSAQNDGDSPLPRLDVTIEHDSYVAGQANVVRLLISNPYDQDIEVLNVQTPQTSSFREYKDNASASGQDNESNIAATLRAFSRTFAGAFAVSLAGVTVELPRLRRQVSIHAEPKSTVVFDRSLDDFTDVSIHAEEGGRIEVNRELIDAHESEPQNKPIILRPRSTIVVPVSVKTRQWLLFTPQRFGLNVEISLRLKEARRSQVITTQMDIRPPLSSMIYGAVIGGFLGSLVASLNKPDTDVGHTFLHCLTAILMSGIAAVSLSRRGNTQAFVTVEDFFGAFFIGSLIGYGGIAYSRRLSSPLENKA